MKRLLKLAISAGFLLYMLARAVIRWLGNEKGPRPICVVLYYHAITPADRARFAKQMDALVRWTTPIAADNRLPLNPGVHYSVVTFDDGFLCAVENAVPELTLRKIPTTLFVPAELLGTIPKWTTFGDDYVGQEQIARADQLNTLNSDLITIGSHTMSHPLLPALPAKDAKFEIFASRDELEKLLNREVRLFSFPYGAFNAELIELCREAGYARVFTTSPSLAFTEPEEYVTGRVSVAPTDWPLEFRLKLLGSYQWLPWAFAWKRKISSRMTPASP